MTLSCVYREVRAKVNRKSLERGSINGVRKCSYLRFDWIHLRTNVSRGYTLCLGHYHNGVMT